MKKELRTRIINEGVVDTRNYRYRTIVRSDLDYQWLEIVRIRLEHLDTTAAIDGWETVEVIK